LAKEYTMFHSSPKPKPARRAWAVQLLTHDYVMEGLLQPRIDDANLYFNDLSRMLKQSELMHGLDLPLSNVRIQPATNLAFQPQTFDEWTIQLGWNVVAFVPADADSLNALRQEFDNFKYPFAATLYAGPYQVRATLLADSKLGWSSLTAFLPLADAQIDCLVPGARLTGWRVPWLLLNGLLVQGDARRLAEAVASSSANKD
jgi:hypothetical protein